MINSMLFLLIAYIYGTFLVAILVFVLFALRKERERLTFRADYDRLTGLYRREKFIEAVSVELDKEKRLKEYGCLLLVDVDNFKKINDNFGHNQGDVVLKTIGEILKGTKRSYDIVGRYGGEEFVVFLPGSSVAGGVNFSKRFMESTRSRTQNFISGPVMYSIGIASFPEDSDSLSTLIKKADEAMYVAKKTKNTIYIGNEMHRKLFMEYSNKAKL